MNAKQIDQIDKRIREICTYHGDEGTSGYLLSNEQFDQIRHAITELLEGRREMKKKEVYGQLVHKGCGGEIVLVSNGKEVKFTCKRCRDLWDLSLPIYGMKTLAIDFLEEFELYQSK